MLRDIIDKETAASDLLAVARQAVKCIGKAEAEGVYRNCVVPTIGKRTLEQLDAVIKKAESK